MSCTRKIKDKIGVVRHTYNRPKRGICDCGSSNGILLNTNAYECPRCTALRKQTSNRVSLSQKPTVVMEEYHAYLLPSTAYDPINWSCYK
jgi:hypothetical protein